MSLVSDRADGRGAEPPAAVRDREGDPPPRQRRLWSGTALIIGILTLLVTGAGSWAGWQSYRLAQANNAKETAVDDAATLQQQVEDLRRRNRTLSADNDTLTAENDDLRAEIQRLEAIIAGGGGPDQPTNPTEGTVRRQGPLTFLPTSDPTDLDARADDPQWGRSSESRSYDADLSLSSGGYELGPSYDARLASLGRTTPSFDLCRSAAYGSEWVEVKDFEAGMTFCVQTNDGRYAALTVTEVKEASFTMQVVTYEKDS